MLIFRTIADMVLIAGTLLVVWELLTAAKILTTPPQENAQNILNAVKRLHQLVDKKLSQLSEDSGARNASEVDDDSSHEVQ